ncbi:MAG: hypothetical protein M1269_02590 [Chloroflexi bacterium]|nr:hypothetical protein [Chloroflexota bacterium]
MNFEAVGNIQNIMTRMNQIQTRIDNIGTKELPNFESVFQNALQARMSTTAMRPNFLPTSLSMLNYPGMMGTSGTGWISELARSNPTQIVEYKDFKMQAQTAERYANLEELIAARFPGRKVEITSTMEGRHSDPNHPAGKALDFVVEGLTQSESRELEVLCSQAGLKPYNEYINDSTYKTGDHMHVDLIEA